MQQTGDAVLDFNILPEDGGLNSQDEMWWSDFVRYANGAAYYQHVYDEAHRDDK